MRLQTMSRYEAVTELKRNPFEALVRYHPTHPGLLIVSYMHEGRARHTLLTHALDGSFQEVELVEGHTRHLTHSFANVGILEVFLRSLTEGEDPVD